jgi:hypothetical protein
VGRGLGFDEIGRRGRALCSGRRLWPKVSDDMWPPHVSERRRPRCTVSEVAGMGRGPFLPLGRKGSLRPFLLFLIIFHFLFL